MNEELNRYIGEGMKTFCPDCQEWTFPVIDRNGSWCYNCYPKGYKSWYKLTKERSIKSGYNRYQRGKCTSKA